MQDLSSLVKGLMGDSSMHAGNTVSVNPPFSPPGSESEASQGIPTHSRPELDVPPVSSTKDRAVKASSSFSMSETSWKKLK